MFGRERENVKQVIKGKRDMYIVQTGKRNCILRALSVIEHLRGDKVLGKRDKTKSNGLASRSTSNQLQFWSRLGFGFRWVWAGRLFRWHEDAPDNTVVISAGVNAIIIRLGIPGRTAGTEKKNGT